MKHFLILSFISTVLIFSSCKKMKIKNKCCEMAHIYYEDNTSLLIVPNVITANGDDINDFLKIQHIGIVEFNIKIRNSFGMIIFETSDIDNSWNGKYNNNKIKEGVFKIIVSAKTITGITINKESTVGVVVKRRVVENVGNCYAPSGSLNTDATIITKN